VASRNYLLAQQAKEAAEKEMRFKTLILLSRIVRTRSEMPLDTFLARFAGKTAAEREDTMEIYLRIAMVQGITPRSKLHRDWTWNSFNATQITATIPGFKTAYRFYEAYDQELARNPQFQRLGFFLVPQVGDKGHQWIEVQVR
jgi:hypothetical protein